VRGRDQHQRKGNQEGIHGGRHRGGAGVGSHGKSSGG
jgi:hypothetical protein